jgi:type II secretion system protein F
MGYFPITINQGAKRGAKAAAPAPRMSTKTPANNGKGATKPAAPAAGTGRSFSFQRRGISAADLAGFNRQLADLLGAGIPLVKGLAILNKQTTNETLRGVIMDILDDVQGGTTFADALGRHPQVFSKLYVAMVKSGEAGGMLDEILQRLADFSEQEEQLKGKIKSALAYPAVMVFAGSVAVFVMFTYVIPKITQTFEQLNQTLPGITQLLITISSVMQQYWMFVLLAGGVAGVMAWQFVKSAEGRAMWHRWQLQLPLIGPLVQKREVARFARTLGSLLRNGVSILVALEIVKEVLDNTVVRAEVERVVDEITQGSSVAAPLRDSAVFPAIAVNMIAIGEETGRLPEVLLRVSESFEIQTERTVRTLTSLLEPLIILAMGCVVGFIVIAMLLPIFSLDPSGGGG